MNTHEHTKQQVEQMKQRLLVMELFLEGHPIEWCMKREGIWRLSTDPQWEPAWDWAYCDYRVHELNRKEQQ